MSASSAAQASGTSRYSLEWRAMTQKISPDVADSACLIALVIRTLSASEIIAPRYQLPDEPPPPKEPPPPEEPEDHDEPPDQPPPLEPLSQPVPQKLLRRRFPLPDCIALCRTSQNMTQRTTSSASTMPKFIDR